MSIICNEPLQKMSMICNDTIYSQSTFPFLLYTLVSYLISLLGFRTAKEKKRNPYKISWLTVCLTKWGII